MNSKYNLIFILLAFSFNSFAQQGWTMCNIPSFSVRIDDVFMADTNIGYAVNGDGSIFKTTDGANNWNLLNQDPKIYCRSVEFINTQKGFVGGFPGAMSSSPNILRRTTDGGVTWVDQTFLLDPRAQKGICGLCAADSNTIYGCGNWYEDSAYVVKSTDGGDSWNFIDMHAYAASLIDMYFLNKDTGFVTGTSPLPLRTAVILYTTNGGLTWTYKFQNNITQEYCWKIQHQTDQIYFASIEDMTQVNPRILKSIDGGMNWSVIVVDSFRTDYDIEGIGFIDTLKGWTGGNFDASYETIDGGLSWNAINFCPYLNRLYKLDDSLIFASGASIFKYNKNNVTGIQTLSSKPLELISVDCYPNPATDLVTISTTLKNRTHAMLIIFDERGKIVKLIDNSDKAKGDYQYSFNTKYLPAGNYFIVLKTHEDKRVKKIQVIH